MATFKEISSSDITTSRSFLNQLVDVIQEDISGSTTRQKYQVFVTGGVGPGVTSSLFHTVHDQDFTLQTANPVFDMTVGMNRDYVSGTLEIHTSEDDEGKLYFPMNTLMMREKINVYHQFAQLLLNNHGGKFVAPFASTSTDDEINNAFFVCYKRLFSRDAIKRETYAMKFYASGCHVPANATAASEPEIDTDGDGSSDYVYNDSAGYWEDDGGSEVTSIGEVNWINVGSEAGTSINAEKIFTDVGSSTSQQMSYGGAVGNIVDASDTNRTVGLLFYDHGIAVYDLAKIMDPDQYVSGVINAVSAETSDTTFPGSEPQSDGFTIIGAVPSTMGPAHSNQDATFIPDFMVSGSMDNILDHIGSQRFGSGTYSAMTFQNVTNINSTLIFCRATADEFNYSSNPTFTDSENRIVVIDEGSESTQRTFSFITSVGLYDANNTLLAVAKLSRPVEKNDEKDLTMRVRLDF